MRLTGLCDVMLSSPLRHKAVRTKTRRNFCACAQNQAQTDTLSHERPTGTMCTRRVAKRFVNAKVPTTVGDSVRAPAHQLTSHPQSRLYVCDSPAIRKRPPTQLDRLFDFGIPQPAYIRIHRPCPSSICLYASPRRGLSGRMYCRGRGHGRKAVLAVHSPTVLCVFVVVVIVGDVGARTGNVGQILGNFRTRPFARLW